MEYYTFSSYILQVHAQSALQSNESCLKSYLPLLLQERGADNVEVSRVGPWTEGRTMTGHAIESLALVILLFNNYGESAHILELDN